MELNFEGADIRSAAKTILGDTLGVSYVVDPRVQGNLTLASAGPIRRKDVLPVFESALRMSNAAVVREGKVVKVVPATEATSIGAENLGAEKAGFGVSVVPLRYTSAVPVARVAENFLTRPGAIRIDQARNLLLFQGTTAERQAALEVVATFDVEWMSHQSVGVYPLKATAPETMIRELEKIFESNEGGQGDGVIRFQPVSRMNAVMVVSKNPKFLEQATQWVKRLDRSDTSATTVRVYRLKYGKASQVAKILSEIFVGQQSNPTVGDKPSEIAPGMSTAQSQLDSNRSAGSGANGSPAAPAAASAGVGAASPQKTRIAAAFANFSTKDPDPDATIALTSSSTNGSSRSGIFQNVRITANTAENAVVVYSNQEDYRKIERALREIDRPKLQVAIEATIAEVTLTDELQFGLQYFLSNKNASAGLLSPTAQSIAAAQDAVQSTLQSAFVQKVAPGMNLLLGPGVQPNVILTALSSLTNVKVLSAPSVVVMDKEPALLQVGEEIPVSTGVATVLSSPTTPVVNTIEMRNTGVILKVLPQIGSNGTIQLEIEQEISNVVNPNQATLTPTISQRRLHSTVSVTNGQTVLLGGLISEQDQRTKAGIPILKDIAVIGDLFGTQVSNRKRSEIIMFIKPQLVRNSIDARQVAEEFRDRLQIMRGEP